MRQADQEAGAASLGGSDWVKDGGGQTRLADAEAEIKNRAEREEFSGAILVAHNGTPLLCQGYGWANSEQSTRNTPQTKFQIASISKQFTALAILILQEQGRLQVHAPLNALVPTGMAAWRDVTLHHLLTHTSGIPDLAFWPNYIDPAGPGPITPRYLHELYSTKPLQAAPGTSFVYSNWGYMLLGYVIEQVSGLSYAAFLQQSIFDPTGMIGSGYADRKNLLRQRAASYAIEQGRLVNASFLDLEDAYAAGGLYSTLDDLLCWDRVLSAERLVSTAMLSTMFTAHTPVGDGSSYGYGWQIGMQHGRRMVYHGGRIDGFRVLLARYPDDQICIAVLCNLYTCNPDAIGTALSSALFGTEQGRA